ncbi:GTPase domain-containing protein [Methylomonas sp. SURF-2]|uniref:GTPase domain-containing protein n=1 Tax=Methylomonas subterranea TaxID=2952225 RepID=A0ABT1TC72_9GAMM|nr:GTPase domain-containing protein [Methylomonas sp. SURF-2]MCQ8103062.1 GTPase domain-containing protein [Methylomonas sp. SURF-2]
MAIFDEESKRLSIKLVYYGPAQSGKTTNLMRLHDILRPDLKGDIMLMETANDRTLFFDLLPLGFKAPSGLLIKFKLYTVPGQVVHDSTRKAVLSRADGVVFVADSQRGQSTNNGESFANLEDNAARVGIDFDRLPLVVQFNKRDLSGILSEEEVLRRWQAAPWPVLFSSALVGDGVVETFNALLKQVYDSLDREFEFQARHDLSRAAFIAQASGQIDRSPP